MVGQSRKNLGGMPRAFDSGEQSGLLHFTELVDCPACGLTFDGDFTDGSMSVEDIVDPPQGRHQCPGCGHGWVSEMTGWNFFTEAG